MKRRRRTTPPIATRKFGSLLRKLRKTSDLSVVDLAKEAEVDPTLLSRIETGTRRPPELRTLIRLGNALRIRPGSEQFEQLWTLAEQERHPGGNAAEHVAKMKELTVVALKQVLSDLDVPAAGDGASVLPVFVEDVAGLVASSNAEIIRRGGATSITVRFADGTTKRWQVMPRQAEDRDV